MREASLGPVSALQRLELLDGLRGLAMFGILMVNMPLMYQPISTLMLGPEAQSPLHHRIAESVIKMLFEGKFYVLFSLLFGYGFWMFTSKDTREGPHVRTRYLRRVAVLLLFGMTHVVLLWAGDVLAFYALFGVLLLAFRPVKDRTAVIWATVFIAIPLLLAMLGAGGIALLSRNPEASMEFQTQWTNDMQALRAFVENAAETYAHGSFRNIVAVRIEEYIGLLPGIVFFYPVVMGMFLLGMLAARHGLLADPIAHTRVFRTILRWGLLIGLPSGALYAFAYRHTGMTMPGGWSLLSTVLHTVGGIALGWSYAAAFVLCVTAGKARTALRLLAPVGRMALSNYIMHSLIAAMLFHSYGFGLFGRIEIWHGMLLCVLIFSLQILVSAWWFRRFHFGPLEWLWRVATYGTAPVFRAKNASGEVTKLR